MRLLTLRLAVRQAAVWDANGCGALTNIIEGGHFLNVAVRSASGVMPLAARCLGVIAQDSNDAQVSSLLFSRPLQLLKGFLRVRESVCPMRTVELTGRDSAPLPLSSTASYGK